MAYEQNRFLVIGTETAQRRKAKDDYILCVNAEVKKQLGLGKFAAVVHTVSYQGQHKRLQVPCQVVLDQSLPDHQVRADQTIRNAIGIPLKYDQNETFVEVYPLRLSLFQWIRERVSRLLGRRYLFLRTNTSHVPDMEKNLARIPPDAFDLLGTTAGSSIVLQSVIKVKKRGKDKYVLREFTIKIYGLLPEILEQRKKLAVADLSALRIDAEKVLGVVPDISPIFLDAQARDALGVELLDPLKARRNLLNLFLKELREFGIIFFISLFAIVQVFPVELDWLSLGLSFLGALIVALVLILVNIRARVK